MDKILPSLEHKDRNGLPCYPPNIENQILRTFYSGLEPSETLEPLMDAWIWTRAAVIREAKERHPGDQTRVARAMGWEPRKDSKKRKRHTNEDTRGNGKDTPVGSVEAGAEGREGLQGPVSDHR